MASNLFKLRYIPNADGSDSAIALTNANTAFVHTYVGDDLTGDGTREYPYRSVGKAFLKGLTYHVFRGVINEPFNNRRIIIGDDINQTLIATNYTVRVYQISNLTIDSIIFDNNNYDSVRNRLIVTLPLASSYYDYGYYYCLFKQGRAVSYNGGQGHVFNSTLSVLNLPANMATSTINSNSITYSYLSLGNLSSTLKYMIFPTTCSFKYNGINIITPNWTNDSKANMVLLKTALMNAGMSQVGYDYNFPKDSFGNDTCRIVWQQKDGGSHPNIFNRYDSDKTTTLNGAITAGAKTTITVIDTSTFPATGDIFIESDCFTYTAKTSTTFVGASQTMAAHSSGVTVKKYGEPLDWTLNPDINNEALFAGDAGGFVGCFKPVTAIKSVGTGTWQSPIDVNTDGTDTVNAGTLLVNTNDSISFAPNPSVTTQVWNRMKGAQVITLGTGVLFNGIESLSTDGSPYGYYIGKHQELMDPTQINEGTALVVGNIYKVCNSVHVTANGVTYNGNNYPPDYFFKCISASTSFVLVTAGSGTYLRKVNCDPLESIEVIPYLDATNVSVFYPKFSCPLSGDVKMLFYSSTGAIRYGKTLGAPVLFGDLKAGNFLTDFPSVCDKISYYDTWGVTNADQEFYTLASNAYFSNSTPLLKYLKVEMNGHFNAQYDY